MISEVVTKRFRTISQFKQEVFQIFKVPVSEQVLMYSNRQLQDKETFDELMRKHNLS